MNPHLLQALQELRGKAQRRAMFITHITYIAIIACLLYATVFTQASLQRDVVQRDESIAALQSRLQRSLDAQEASAKERAVAASLSRLRSTNAAEASFAMDAPFDLRISRERIVRLDMDTPRMDNIAGRMVAIVPTNIEIRGDDATIDRIMLSLNRKGSGSVPYAVRQLQIRNGGAGERTLDMVLDLITSPDPTLASESMPVVRPLPAPQ